MLKILLPLLLSLNSFASESVIYGDDNRLDLYEVKNTTYLRMAQATAAQIPSYRIKEQDDGSFNIRGYTHNVCKDAKFKGQDESANCSGFLTEHKGKQYLITAGHCISESECADSKWVFNYSYKTQESLLNPIINVSSSSVYSCARIVDRKLSRYNYLDHAVIELDRKVEGQETVELNTTSKAPEGVELVMIGYPSGLPTKVAAGAFVRNNSHASYFVANTDSFAGNSGSAVINTQTGLVEGILVRGETDYVWTTDDDGKRCKRPVHCEMDGCRGEDVTRISTIDLFK